MADDAWRDLFDDFKKRMERRLVNGALEYGDRSLTAHPAVILREVAEEFLDSASWGYLGWRAIAHLIRAMEHSDKCPLCGASVAPVEPAKAEDIVL